MSFEEIKNTAEFATYLIAIGGATWGLIQYTKSVSRERLRWLNELWSKYHLGEEFTAARRLVVWAEADLMALKDRANAGDAAAVDQMIKIDNFLNFFEFIALLNDRDELPLKDAWEMFGGPLRSLRENATVAPYLAYAEYQKLPKLLAQLPPAATPTPAAKPSPPQSLA